MAAAHNFFPRPPSGDIINAVLRFADIGEDLGGGRTHYRLSDKRLRQREVRAVLGKAGVERAADIGVVWDERQDEIVRVLDRAA
jgi:hypothetical protein